MIPEAGEETLQAVLNGDAEAFRSILRSYGPRVERLVSAHVLPHEVPEVAQETSSGHTGACVPTKGKVPLSAGCRPLPCAAVTNGYANATGPKRHSALWPEAKRTNRKA